MVLATVISFPIQLPLSIMPAHQWSVMVCVCQQVPAAVAPGKLQPLTHKEQQSLHAKHSKAELD